MKTLKEFYEFLLHEAAPKKPTPQGEAPKDAEFGKFAFAPTRNDVPTPKEPNTTSEEEVKKALSDYFRANKKGPLASKAQLLWKLASDGYYSKALNPGSYSTAYRLLRLSKEAFAKIVGIQPEEVRMYGVLGAGSLAPGEGGISGWTVSPSLFTKDGFDVYADGEVVVVFIASIANNKFFGNPGVLPKMIDEPYYSYEMETIALGPVAYDKAAYALLSPREEKSPELLMVRIARMLSYAGVK